MKKVFFTFAMLAIIVSGCSKFEEDIANLNNRIDNIEKVTIPSILVKAGDVIVVKETSKESVKIKALAEGMATAVAPKWLENDVANLATKVVSFPAREDIDFEFEEQLIVELYSK